MLGRSEDPGDEQNLPLGWIAVIVGMNDPAKHPAQCLYCGTPFTGSAEDRNVEAAAHYMVCTLSLEARVVAFDARTPIAELEGNPLLPPIITERTLPIPPVPVIPPVIPPL